MENGNKRFHSFSLSLLFDHFKIKFEEYYNTYHRIINRFFDTLMIQKEQQMLIDFSAALLQIILELFYFHYIIPILFLECYF
jgi:hypothetical protein